MVSVCRDDLLSVSVTAHCVPSVTVVLERNDDIKVTLFCEAVSPYPVIHSWHNLGHLWVQCVGQLRVAFLSGFQLCGIGSGVE